MIRKYELCVELVGKKIRAMCGLVRLQWCSGKKELVLHMSLHTLKKLSAGLSLLWQLFHLSLIMTHLVLTCGLKESASLGISCKFLFLCFLCAQHTQANEFQESFLSVISLPIYQSVCLRILTCSPVLAGDTFIPWNTFVLKKK